MAIDENKIEELRTKHGEVWQIDGLQVDVACRCPTQAEWRKFITTVSDEKRRALAPEELANRVVVYPDTATWNAMCERRPGLPTKVAEAVQEIATEAQTDVAKKL